MKLSGAESEQTQERERQSIIHQINPHFVFNTLATIRIITRVNSDLAYDMIYDFSKYLRAVIQSLTNPENITFKEEMDYVISYTNLQRIRFGDNIGINIDIRETDFMIPPMALQPLLENAIIHGLKKGKLKGRVSIRSYQNTEEYIVQVEDDGAGFDVKKYNGIPEEGSLKESGLQRVRNRLEQMLGGKLEVKSTIGKGTVVTLHIPRLPEDK